MNIEIGIEAAQFPEKEHINGIFVAVYKKFLTHIFFFCISYFLDSVFWIASKGGLLRSSSMLMLSVETLRVPSLRYEPGTQLAAGCRANNLGIIQCTHSSRNVHIAAPNPTELAV
jgi:hypothetical protein